MTIGPIPHRSRLVAANLAPLEAVLGRPLKAILGGDFFQGYVVQLDYEAQLMRLFDANSRSTKSPSRQNSIGDSDLRFVLHPLP